MHMRPGDPSPPVRRVRAAPRFRNLATCLCAIVALSAAASSQAQTKLDVRKLFAEHLRHASSLAALEINGPLAAVPSADTDPVPIPGGINIPPLIHIFAPGPVDLGFQGLDVELTGITNFQGFSAFGVSGGNRHG